MSGRSARILAIGYMPRAAPTVSNDRVIAKHDVIDTVGPELECSPFVSRQPRLNKLMIRGVTQVIDAAKLPIAIGEWLVTVKPRG